MLHRLASVLLLLLLSGCGLLPARWQRPGPEPLPQDTQVVRGTLPNGLRYYVRVNREPRARAELRLAINAGSVLEDEDQLGLAHFVEHMAFNGTRNFEKQALVDYLERVGMRFGPDINAYTSFDETVYMLTLPTDSAGVLETGLRILHDWASGVSFDSTEVEKERGVVIEEWRQGQGAGARLQDRQFPVLTRSSRYAERLPIGTLRSLESFRPEALRRFYRDWYRPDLMAVVAVGDFDPARVERLIQEQFGSLPASAAPRPRRDFTVPPHDSTLVSIATDPEATGSNISLYLKREPRPWHTVGDYRDWIVESLASSMLTDRLSERTQRPESPFLDVSSFQGRYIRPLTAYVLSVRVPDGRIDRGLEQLLTEVARVEQHGFTRTELQRAKSEMLRRVEQRYLERDKATSAGFAADYVSHFLYGGSLVSTEAESALYQRLVPQVTLADVDAVVDRWRSTSNRVVLVSAPQKATVRVPTEQRLRSVIQNVRRRAVPPYTDSLSSAPLVVRPPQPGRVVAERRHEAVGVTEWTLSNGARVLLKPTDYLEDEVLLAASSPGGASLLPDSDYVAVLTAPAIVQAGGMGALSSIELRKRLAGKVAGVGADIHERSEGLSGAASPRDMETLLQLVYLKFTAPRLDSAAIEAYRVQAKNALANRRSSPEVVFSDSLRLILGQYHPRVRPVTSEMFEQLDIQRSFEIYRERFADAGDFTFYLAGTLNPDSIRPLVERYIGGLPSRGGREVPRDLGIRPPRGVVRRVVRKGLEPKAITQIVFTGPLEFSRENLYELNVLEEVLRLRLRDALREEKGGTYGVQVRAGGQAAPNPQYTVALGYGSDPARVPELAREVFAQIDSLRRVGPRADEVEKVREAELRARETDLRSNQFWVGQMMAFDRSGWKLDDILAYPGWVQRVDVALVRRAAQQYLDPGNYVQASLLPEGTATPRGGGGTELP